MAKDGRTEPRAGAETVTDGGPDAAVAPARGVETVATTAKSAAPVPPENTNVEAADPALDRVGGTANADATANADSAVNSDSAVNAGIARPAESAPQDGIACAAPETAVDRMTAADEPPEAVGDPAKATGAPPAEAADPAEAGAGRVRAVGEPVETADGLVRAWADRSGPAGGAPESADTPTETAVDQTETAGGPAGNPGAANERTGAGRRALAWALTVLACLLVLFALVAPNAVSELRPESLLRLPVEGLLGLALLLVLPPRVRRIGAILLGVVLGLLTVLKIIDMGFLAALSRPFDPVSDWSFFGPAVDFLSGAIGHAGALGAVVGAALLAVAVVLLLTLAVARLTRLVAGRRGATLRAVAALGVVWIVLAVAGVQLAPGQPVAASSAATLAYDDLLQVRTDLRDQQAFTTAAGSDAFRDTPGSALLTGLRGKDVILAFVESYGRVAVQDSDIAPGVDAVLDAGTQQLRAAGYGARTGFLTSSTTGGGSWLAHSTLESGLWINNPQRYDEFTASDRLTLASAFRRAGWRTVGDVPENTKDWPQGDVYRFDTLYDARNVGYHGPNFAYGNMPDQFTLSAYQRMERAAPGHAPVMAEIDLVSSHSPWTHLPHMIGWNDVGDGSVFDPMPAAGKSFDQVWPNPVTVRAAYGQSIQYSLSALISYVLTYGDKNLVLVFLGDHQPATPVVGAGATRDVPITIVARDPAVLDRVAGWGWTDGLRPSPQAPVWPMNTFRDRFLTAFGP
jgi:hypothetical protein